MIASGGGSVAAGTTQIADTKNRSNRSSAVTNCWRLCRPARIYLYLYLYLYIYLSIYITHIEDSPGQPNPAQPVDLRKLCTNFVTDNLATTSSISQSWSWSWAWATPSRYEGGL